MEKPIKERPILFSAPMVRALLDGRKTQTRRALRQQPVLNTDTWEFAPSGGWIGTGPSPATGGTRQTLCWTRCPYGQPGDRLWVREAHRPIFGQTCGLIGVDYQAEPREKWERLGDAPDCLMKLKWTPSIHMRREYSRIVLEVVSVRVERLQDISEVDCLAEGVHAIRHDGDGTYYHYEHKHADPGNWCNADDAYQHLWESINGAGSWDANPWVWVVEFKRAAPTVAELGLE